MRLSRRSSAVVALAGALAIAAPAAAHPGPGGNHGRHNGQGQSGTPGDHGRGSSRSRRCEPHNVAYVESGTIDATTASTLAQNPDGTWSGTLVVDVRNVNHHALGDRGKTVTYTFTDAHLRVRFQHGTTTFAAGERVKLIGKIEMVARRCMALTPAPAPTFRMIVVVPAAS
ncbi:MAG TPA: hypothetical protein VKV27_03260 [Solirubrobacteraceae bacterium]|nr:hypothetical protein [Solirubrobacteraceae bacterium]